MAELWEIVPNPTVSKNKGGRPPKFPKPADLWDSFTSYCQWVHENPMKRYGVEVKNTGKKDEKQSQKQKNFNRPLTLYGFCAFAGIPKWTDFKRSYSGKKGFSAVIANIENIVAADQMDGAMLKLYDGNIVARLLGLADRQEVSAELDVEKYLTPLTDEELKWLDKHRNG